MASFFPSSTSSDRSYPDDWDFYLEMPISSLSNGESPVFLVGPKPLLKMRLLDGSVRDAPLLGDLSGVDESLVPEGAVIVRPELGEPNGAFVVKFFSHLQKKRSQNTEIAAHMMFSCLARGKELRLSGTAPRDAAEFVHEHTPMILAHGALYELRHGDISDIEAWVEPGAWPYIVMPYIHGWDLEQTFPYDEAADLLPLRLPELTSSAEFLGKYLRSLHQFEVGIATKPNVNPLYNRGWRGFETWLVKRRRIVTRDRPIAPDSINAHLKRIADDYLPRDVRILTEWYKNKHGLENPRLLHGDLNEEHLLLIDRQPYAVIDYGDCFLGDPQYEWIPVLISSFRCKKHLLITALQHYYQCQTLDEIEQQVGGWSRFSYNMMCYTLLAQQDAMRTVYGMRPELIPFDNFESLANEIWNLSIDQKS